MGATWDKVSLIKVLPITAGDRVKPNCVIKVPTD